MPRVLFFFLGGKAGNPFLQEITQLKCNGETDKLATRGGNTQTLYSQEANQGQVNLIRRVTREGKPETGGNAAGHMRTNLFKIKQGAISKPKNPNMTGNIVSEIKSDEATCSRRSSLLSLP